MNPRNFLRISFAIAALAGAVCAPSTTVAADASPRQYYELRVYITESERQQKLVNDYWQNARSRAYTRMGIQPVGVFTELENSPTNKIYVLTPL